MGKKLVVNETAQNLPEQFSILGSGAQYVVAMLTGPEISHHEFISKPHDSAPRVLKIPLSTDQVALAVDSLGIPENQHAEKVELLIWSRIALGVHALGVAAYDPFVHSAFGRPHAVFTNYRQSAERTSAPKVYLSDSGIATQICTEGAIYTQDYNPSIKQYISSEPGSRESQVLRHLIDQYAILQTRLVRHGYFDDIFKLDNYGWRNDELRVNDFSEFQIRPQCAAEVIRQRKWENIVDNKEYTQMHPVMQDYFNDTLQRTLPLRIMDVWGVDLPYVRQNKLPLFAQDIVEHRHIERIMMSFEEFLG